MASFRADCAWCGEVIYAGEHENDPAISHGICLRCCRQEELLEVEQHSNFKTNALNDLPFGAIELDKNGRAVQYNEAESELCGLDPKSVIAPCTHVKECGGQFRNFLRLGVAACIDFDVVFMFDEGSVVVDIVMIFDEATRSTLPLIKKSPIR